MQAQPQDDQDAILRRQWIPYLRANLRQGVETSLFGYGMVVVLASLVTVLAAKTQPPDAAMATCLRSVLHDRMRPAARLCWEVLVYMTAVYIFL
ncbi:hypothetical protein PgNI_10227 [Pyricularia grisea]|uniref:Uncharacterized protein n=1 Tax=Pyricularia grisea TaxID=148305 RepID=A0A6P8AZX6_PYRGI|nr:hypothetical protein PgNI_10227 [Pyricularia grisea]TLD07781.1 hypothetical protein PgNI_10227 [Pyricularia grisea]